MLKAAENSVQLFHFVLLSAEFSLNVLKLSFVGVIFHVLLHTQQKLFCHYSGDDFCRCFLDYIS